MLYKTKTNGTIEEGNEVFPPQMLISQATFVREENGEEKKERKEVTMVFILTHLRDLENMDIFSLGVSQPIIKGQQKLQAMNHQLWVKWE